MHLTPTPRAPDVHADINWAMQHFDIWSRTDFTEAFNIPSTATQVLVLTDGEDFMVDFSPGESDEDLIQRICTEIGLDSEGVGIVRPTKPFNKPTHYHHVLSDIVYLVEIYNLVEIYIYIYTCIYVSIYLYDRL